MNVTMPDGTVVTDVPEGTTQSDLQSRYAAHVAGPPVNEHTAPNGVPLPSDWQPVPAHNDPTLDRFVDHSAVGRVLDQFGQGFKDGFGSQPVLSPETEAAMRGAKLDTSPLSTMRRAFNEAIFRPAATVLDGALRGSSAVFPAFGRATGQVMNELGITKMLGNTEESARRDFEVGAQILPMAMGVAGDLGVVQKTQSKPIGRPAEGPDLGSVAEASPPPPPEPVKVMASTEGLEAPHSIYQEPPAGGVVDKAGNINLNYISAPSDVKDVIRQTATANGGFTDARRGVISLPQTEQLADALGMSPETLATRKVGQAFNAEEVTAARNLLVQSATNVRDLASKVADGDEASLKAFVEAEAKHKAIQEQVAGLTSEAGRALNAFKIQAKAAGEAQDFSAVLKGLGDSTEDAAARARVIGGMDTPEKVSRFLMDSRKPTFKDQFLEYWMNGLLSGPATHTTYTESNALFALWKAGVETPVAGAIGKAREILNPDAPIDRVYMGETGARLHGILQGSKEGIVGFWNGIKNGVPDALPGEEQWPAKAGAIPGLAGDIIRVPSRVIAGIHGFYRAVGYRQSINALAYREIAKTGVEGEDFATALSSLKANPPEDLVAAAREEAAQNAMMAKPEGAFGKRLEALANTNVVTKMIAPFVRVGVNIVDQGLVQRTPLGFLSPEVRKTLAGEYGAAARDTQVARMAVGSALGAATIGLAAQGRITGGGPSDPKQRAALELTGWRPYSAKIGDTYYGYHRMGSLGQIVGVAADMYEIGHHLSDEESNGLAAMIMNSVSKNMVDETWMRGPAELIQAIEDPDRYGKRYIANQAASLLPFSVGVGQVARAIDPDMRDAQGIIQTVKSRIPFVSETLKPRYDLWGQPMPNQGSLGPDALSAVYESRVNNDPVNQEMVRLGVSPAMPEKKIKGVQLTPDQYEEFQTTAGRLAKVQLDQMVNAPEWQAAPAFAQKEIFENTIKTSRQAAAGLMQMRHPELITQGIENRVKQIRGVGVAK